MSIIIDSNLTEQEVKLQNPLLPCPEEILENQKVLGVRYWSFDNKLHQGQIVIDKRLEKDIIQIFEAIEKEEFPITSVVPASDPKFHWDDAVLMDKNNTSAFNYRTIAGQEKLSLHAFGQAIDINPRLNPYINKDGIVEPSGATRDLSKPGTIADDSFLIKLFEELGWEWGGRWKEIKDYQHFQKPIS
ncbi:MAG: M15 family metallopeptidase [Candidatus Paceibacterota bacterium]|jgi:hypothetical protein